MKAGKFEQANRVLGVPPSYKDSGVIVEPTHAYVGDMTNGMPVVITAWYPTRAELVRLALGEPVYCVMLTKQPPPVMLAMDSPWEEKKDEH